jgi:hypothetical protein
MTTMQKMLAALSISCALAACSPSPDEQREPPPVKDTVFGDTVSTMDKARSVEDTTMQHKQELDRAVQDAEGEH